MDRLIEGNFVVSEKMDKKDLRGQLGKAYAKCPKEAAVYAKCVVTADVNRILQSGACAKERAALKECVNTALCELFPRRKEIVRPSPR